MTYEEALRLSGSSWTKLEDSQKLAVLQAVEDQAAKECGRQPCKVVGAFLPIGKDSITLGLYEHSTGTIYINDTQFAPDSLYGSSPQKLLETCLHEGRHSLQHQAVDGTAPAPSEELLKQWKENFAPGNYISFEQNPVAYYNQPVEADARTYAAERSRLLVQERSQLQQQTMTPQEQSKAAFEQQMQAPSQGAACSQNLSQEESLHL